jgi:hypothetical protein
MEAILGYLLIFFARLADVSLATFRMIMVIRGKRIIAACIGFVEATIYILAVGKVLSAMNNPLNILAYALGFATGNYVGIFLEEKMALGSIIVQVILEHEVIINIIPLRINVNNPNVNILIGKVKTTKIGLIIVFIMPKIAAATIVVLKLDTLTPIDR